MTKVAHELGAVMIDHDPIAVLAWPAMNMTFAIRDQALLDNIEQGDRIDFLFVKSGEDYIITAIK